MYKANVFKCVKGEKGILGVTILSGNLVGASLLRAEIHQPNSRYKNAKLVLPGLRSSRRRRSRY